MLGRPAVACLPEAVARTSRHSLVSAIRNEEDARMSTPVTVSRFETKSHDTPDEVRTPEKTRIEVVRLDGFTIGRFTFQPGWRWSECIKPVVGTETCQNS